MAKRRRTSRSAPKDAAPGALLSLSEVARRAGISMPTALRYKRDHAARLPSVGKGRTQRYRPEAVAIFADLRKASRGGQGQGASAPSEGGAGGYLSLSEVGRRTNISYPTLLRYVKNHLPQLAHQGEGRTRRFAPEAVEVFARLRRESRRGRRPAGAAGAASVAPAGVARSLGRIERLLENLNQRVRALEKAANRPLRIAVRR